MAPDHAAKSGYVAKIPANYYKIGASWISIDEIACQFHAENPVKLSYHPDGFAQFSSVVNGTITSGRDSTGNIKGVGLMTSPLTNPIRSGPSAGIRVWGFQDFPDHSGSLGAAMLFDFSIIEATDLASDANTFNLEIFTLPRLLLRYTKVVDSNIVVEVPYTFKGVRRVFALRVIEIPDRNVFLGVLGTKLKTFFPSVSGWSIGGPGGYDVDGSTVCLHACYPKPDSKLSIPQLDYKDGSVST